MRMLIADVLGEAGYKTLLAEMSVLAQRINTMLHN